MPDFTASTSELLDAKLDTPIIQERRGPVWEGPCSGGLQGGITQSLVARWLVCRERFRLLTVEGLKASEGWNHKIGYGNLWHTAEEAHLGGKDWKEAITKLAQEECHAYPMDQNTIEHWWMVCSVQFPIYLEFWSRHPDEAKRIPLLQETEFHVMYPLSSGRIVFLRGKWDAVELLNSEAWCVDHKTKGDLDTQQIARQLQRDLQTMFYLVALETPDGLASYATNGRHPLRGVRYNCIRRPLSGGKGTIRQHQPTKSNPMGESREAFYGRVAQVIRDDLPYFFQRFSCEVTQDDITKFRRECLDPILENICDDWEWWWYCSEKLPSRYTSGAFDPAFRHTAFPHHWPRHYLMPFGVYSPINEGRASDLDNYLATKSEVGLTRVTNLFPELRHGERSREREAVHPN